MLTETASPTQDAPESVTTMATRPPNNPGELPAIGLDESKTVRLGGLVLTRHLGESIMIGDEVQVQVVGVKAGTVKLKVVAPRTIAVHRREIFDAIQSGAAMPEAALASAPERVTPRPGKPAGGLVLTRSARQSIMIGENVEISVVQVRPSIVKLRISAPRSVPVHRLEVFESLKRDQA